MTAPTVWGVFVGEHGDQLEIFNSNRGPFPPTKDSEGYIAIGWPAIGDLRMFENNYIEYVDRFRIVYGGDIPSERVFKTKANMPWNFAFEMTKGDWVICPCTCNDVLLIGEIIGDYDTDYHGKLKLDGKKRPDFVHVRQVIWREIIPATDERYHELNRIGQLTVSRQKISFAELGTVLNRKRNAAEALPPEDDEDDPLYQAALAVEKEEQLSTEMAEWEIATIGDGLGDGTPHTKHR